MELDKYLIKKANEFGISITHGRIGEPLEYVEFDGKRTDRVLYMAQRSGEYWNVFKVWPGKKGRALTLFSSTGFAVTVFYALAACANNQ